MELRHLRVFLAVAEYLHYGRAARALGVAQPSVSQQIRSLEKELDVELFERNRHGVRLTPAGEAFVSEARSLIARAERSVALVREVAHGNVGRLRLGCSLSALGAATLNGIRRFTRDHPAVSLSMTTLGDRAGVDELLGERLEAVLCEDMPAGEASVLGLRRRPLDTSPLVAAIPKHHPLRRRATVAIKDLRGERLLIADRRAHPRLFRYVLEVCGTNGYEPPVLHEVVEETALIALVASGLGLALVPNAWRALQIDGIAFEPLASPETRFATAAFWRSDTANAALQPFLACLLPPKAEAPAVEGATREDPKKP
jgi:DNA-binding transcriptional LysR family regulator